MRIGPASQRQGVVALAQHLAQLPGMFDTPWRPDRLVSPKHHQGRKSVLVRPLGVRETVVEWMLGRQKRHDALPWHIEAEVGDEMPEIVLFLRPDGTVGEE